MPFANLRTVRLRYDLAGPDDAPVLVLSNSLGANLTMWDAQVPEFSRHYRVLRYDTRGHGESSLPAGPHALPLVARDVLDLLDYLAISVASICGLSLGGMTGMWLARHSPERIHRLIVCSAAAKIGTKESWDARIDLVRREGMQAVTSGILERWLTPGFHASAPGSVAAVRRMLEEVPVDGYIAGCSVVRDAALGGDLSGIHVPTLVANGATDPVAPPADGHFLAAHIPGARYIEFAGAHLFTVESAADFSKQALEFLNAT